MKQDEAWQAHWKEVMDFMGDNRRKPSKHYEAERRMHTWCKQQKKLLNAGRLRADRVDRFRDLLGLAEKCRHVNQYK